MSKTPPPSTIELATHFRSTNNLGKVEPLNIFQLLHSIDVITVFLPMSIGFSGMAQRTGNHKFMLINSTHSIARQNFTICHELYHLYYQKEFKSMICSTGQFNKKDRNEFYADSFAADLMLPDFGIMKEIPAEEARVNSITLHTLLKIEHKFQCSRSALLFRLKLKGFIDEDFFNAHNKDIVRGAAKYGYSTSLYKKQTDNRFEVIGNYGDKARQKFDNDSISESHYISLLQDIGIDLDENLGDYVE